MNWYKIAQIDNVKVYLERSGVGDNERYLVWDKGGGYSVKDPKWGPRENAVDFARDGFGLKVSWRYASIIANDILEATGILLKPSLHNPDADPRPGEDIDNTQIDLEDVYLQGWRAAMEGRTLEENPYDIDEQAKEEWINGFYNARI